MHYITLHLTFIPLPLYHCCPQTAAWRRCQMCPSGCQSNYRPLPTGSRTQTSDIIYCSTCWTPTNTYTKAHKLNSWISPHCNFYWNWYETLLNVNMRVLSVQQFWGLNVLNCASPGFWFVVFNLQLKFLLLPESLYFHIFLKGEKPNIQREV